MLHVGALRDALFKYLFARNQGGQNILRIEDTDRTRYSPDSEREFIETLKWVGIDFDEGPHIGGPHAPYRQSERKEAGIYWPWIETLMKAGHAYKAFDTSKELEEMREYQKINKERVGYFGGIWRDASEKEVADAEAEGKPYVIRQRIPRHTIVVEDAIRGRIEWDGADVDDPVLIKADGMPTYHFASMVDDHLMEITHVMRGEEWVSSAPKHAALFDSFGWDRPIFVHMPVILGTDGKKLSKRHGATRVLDYAAQGFLPAALKNFIALIGWSPGSDQEVMTEQELIGLFSLHGLQPSPGKFDFDKLKWLNGHVIRSMDPEELLVQLETYISNPYTKEYWTELQNDEEDPGSVARGQFTFSKLQQLREAVETDRAYVLSAVKEEQERVQTLAEFGEACDFFIVEEPAFDAKAAQKWLTPEHVPELFEWILTKLEESHVETPSHYETILKGYQTHKELAKLGPVVHPTRVALTGKTVGPGLFELMSVLGRSRVEFRLKRALAFRAELI